LVEAQAAPIHTLRFANVSHARNGNMFERQRRVALEKKDIQPDVLQRKNVELWSIVAIF
jgi:hypothetical protein